MMLQHQSSTKPKQHTSSIETMKQMHQQTSSTTLIIDNESIIMQTQSAHIIHQIHQPEPINTQQKPTETRSIVFYTHEHTMNTNTMHC